MPSIQDLFNFLYYNLVLILSDLHIKPVFTINCSLRFNFGSDFVGNTNFSRWSFLNIQLYACHFIYNHRLLMFGKICLAHCPGYIKLE
jgi:hypothetical protein